jgi:hypothetical protein
MSIDGEIARIAARQRQLITLPQLRGCGLSARGAQHRASRGVLHRLHPSVFALHAPPYSNLQRLLAATLACGRLAFGSDLSAAAVFGYAERHPSLPQVTSPTGAGRKLPGIVVRRRQVDRKDIWHPFGIPCTSPARTVLDCASLLDLEDLELILMAADASGKLNRRRLEKLIAASPRRGLANLRLLTSDDPADTRTINERRMRSICREFGVPEPICNHPIVAGDRRFVADFCWPSVHLIVEADSWRWHGGKLATERDANRDQLLAVHGWRVVHFTRNQILKERARTGARLLALTAAAAPPSATRPPCSRRRRAA